MRNLPKRVKYKGQIYEAVNNNARDSKWKEIEYMLDDIEDAYDDITNGRDDNVDFDALKEYIDEVLKYVANFNNKYKNSKAFIDEYEDSMPDIESRITNLKKRRFINPNDEKFLF